MAWTEFREIVSDLTTLEVNTIVKQQITARKMPQPRIALIEIIEKYRSELERRGAPPPISHGEFIKTFKSIRDTALAELDRAQNWVPAAGENDEVYERLIMIHRIERNSENLVYMLEAFDKKNEGFKGRDDLRLDPPEGLEENRFDAWRDTVRKMPELKMDSGDIVKIRKIWEVGHERVVMQSVVQLDGDVVTRVVPKFADPQFRLIHEIHRDGLNVALGMWKELFATIRAILGLRSSEPLSMSVRDAGESS